MRRATLAVMLLVAVFLVAWPAAAQVDVTYLGNEGFLLSAGDTRILVDALYGDGLAGYPVVPRDIRRELEAGRGRFAGVDLVLASHHHGDHYDPSAVARFLRAQPDARFVSTRQAVERLRDDGLADRVHGYWPAEAESETLELDGIKLTVLNLHHGRDRRPEVQNLGFVIEIGGLCVLHVGDTEVSAKEIDVYGLGDAGIDVGLMPVWFFDWPEWRPVLDEIRPRHLVAMHMASPTAPSSYFGPAGGFDRRVAGVRQAVDNVWLPTQALAQRRFERPE